MSSIRLSSPTATPEACGVARSRKVGVPVTAIEDPGRPIRSFPKLRSPCPLGVQKNDAKLVRNLVDSGGTKGRPISRRATERTSFLTDFDNYLSVGECKVYLPPSNLRRDELKGILYFIGCAFLGKAPDLSYNYLFELLTSQGFVIIAVPYALTFQHEVCAKSIHSRFKSCMDILLSDGLQQCGISGGHLSSLPVFGLSHSNGALMHALIGSLHEDDDNLPQANVFVSFNNKPAKDAIPLFDQLGPQVVQLAPMIESFPLTGIVLSLAEQTIQQLDKREFELPSPLEADLRKLSPLADQVPSVFSEIFGGYSEFTPPPEENRKLIASSYSVKKNLLIKFKVDTLDETDALKSLFESRFSASDGQVSLIELDGTHATPLAQDVRWRAQKVYSPLDAVGQSLKSSYLKDVKVFSQVIVNWINNP